MAPEPAVTAAPTPDRLPEAELDRLEGLLRAERESLAAARRSSGGRCQRKTPDEHRWARLYEDARVEAYAALPALLAEVREARRRGSGREHSVG